MAPLCVSCFLPRFSPAPSHLFSPTAACSRTPIVCTISPVTHSASPYLRPRYVPNRIDDPRYVRIFDTTLRDGEQSPGASLTIPEKLQIAQQLAKLGVDIIEVGFPYASPGELEAAKLISSEVGNTPATDDGHVPVICGLARCKKSDLDAAWEGVKLAARPRIHISIATSDIHLEHKLLKTREEVVRIAREMVGYSRSLGCPDIEFGAEDAGRSDPRMLYHIFEEVIKAGATTLDIADTVGSLLPHECSRIVSNVRANTQGADDVIISAHCHNDLGLATANSLAAAAAGARQLEVTINGIGERAGNASLEEIVMAIKSRGQEAMEGIFTGIQTKHISPTSKMVANYTGMKVQPNKAIVGANAFLHESGIHQDGILKYKGTYEFLSPEDIGIARDDNKGIVLGKHSGRHALKTHLLKLGYVVEGKDLDEIFCNFKTIAEKKKVVLDADLKALLPANILKSKRSTALDATI